MTKPDFTVSGQTVLITGGTGGIGRALTDGFTAHGAEVVAADLAEPQVPLAEGVRFEQLDVTDDDAVASLADHLRTVHCVIHCAGMLARWEEYKPEVFSRVIDVHLTSNMRLANAFRPHLTATGGCLINVGSMYSYFGAPQVPAYAAAKTAVVSLTKSLAIAFASDGIRVNAIAPGWIKTEISRGGRENPEFNSKVVARIPNGEWAEPEELAGTAIFLASPAARLVNGVTVPVDGGYCAS